MIQAFKILLLAGLACYAGVCLLVFLFQSRLAYMPSDQEAGTPANLGLELGRDWQEVWLTSKSRGARKRIHAWFVRAAGQARGAVLFCHGNAGNITHRLDTLRILRGLGLDVLIFDYQGYGQSEGHPGEDETYADARAGWDWLMANGARPETTVLMGRSLGGAVAAGLLEQLRDGQEAVPAGLILESTFTSGPDIAAKRFPFLPVRLLARFSYDTLDRMDRVDCPVLVVHSPDDDIVPQAHGLALVKALEKAGKDVDYLEISGDHNTGFLVSKPGYTAGLGRFFDRVLGPGPALE